MKVKFTRDHDGFTKGDIVELGEDAALRIINQHAGVNAGDKAELKRADKPTGGELKKLQAAFNQKEKDFGECYQELEKTRSALSKSEADLAAATEEIKTLKAKAKEVKVS